MPLSYRVPEELKSDFNRDLLEQLVVASFSSDYELKKGAEEAVDKELFIAVKSGDQSVVKTISELRSFQILRLYEIYIEEQINLHALMHEDEKEKAAIEQEREMRLKKWNAVHETIDRDELQAKAKLEQESKLGSLYDQL
jgi:vacuolar-type H+-ATPase subunit I/STV1